VRKSEQQTTKVKQQGEGAVKNPKETISSPTGVNYSIFVFMTPNFLPPWFLILDKGRLQYFPSTETGPSIGL
jgi:hypothetical protein